MPRRLASRHKAGVDGALQLLIVKLADAYTTILLVGVLMSWIPNRSGILADIETVLGRFAIRI